MWILAVLVIGGFALYVMSPAERQRLFGGVLGGIAVLKQLFYPKGPQRDPFFEALSARTRWPLITGAIIAVNIAVFLLMLLSPGESDGETLLAWGGSFGPRTTNGEWWRIITASFVQPGFIALIVGIAALAQPGAVLERLVGPLAFTIVYLSAGMFGNVVNLAIRPVDVHAGAAPAVLGVYGLLIVVVARGALVRTPLTIPLRLHRQIAPAAVVFLLYNAALGIRSAEVTGLLTGIVYGVIVTRRVEQTKPGIRLIATPVVTTLVLMLAAGIALRGVTDVRPELERLAATEERTASIYDKAVGQFRLGAISAKALAQVIDRSIVPELRAARARVESLTGVPRQHQALVASAEEYLRLRDQSWRIRSEALQKARMGALRDADRVERDSLEALERIRTTSPQ